VKQISMNVLPIPARTAEHAQKGSIPFLALASLVTQALCVKHKSTNVLLIHVKTVLPVWMD
jgi:hypothetical protein